MMMWSPDPQLLAALAAMLDPALAGHDRLLVLGICGAQGSGKSTLGEWLCADYVQRGIPAALLSIDDLYLTRADRERLAREVHPLLRTRGVPGTHDTALGLGTLAAIDRGEAAPLPRFGKAQDDRRPPADWDFAPARCRLMIFEGWCVGARPQSSDALLDPVNVLEAREDSTGSWRRFVNDALAGEYQRLFARIDLLLLLAAPGFEAVRGWRSQQERELRARTDSAARGLMNEADIARFVQHYERLTRHILAEMPSRADIVAHLGADRSVRSVDVLE